MYPTPVLTLPRCFPFVIVPFLIFFSSSDQLALLIAVIKCPTEESKGISRLTVSQISVLHCGADMAALGHW